MSPINGKPKPLNEGYVPKKGSLNSNNPPKVQPSSDGSQSNNKNEK